MRLLAIFICLFFISGEAKAVGGSATLTTDPEQSRRVGYREAQQAWIYLGKVNHEKGIRLLSPSENPVERKGGRWCRRTQGERPRFIKFDVEDSFFEGNPPKVEVRVEYFDGDKDTFTTLARTLEGNRRRVGRIVKKENFGTWRSYTSSLLAPLFGKREDVVSEPDLLINNRWDGDEFIRTVRVRIPYLHPGTEKLGNLFEPGEPIKLHVKLFKKGGAERFTLTWHIQDWRGETIESGENPLTATPGFSVVKTLVTPPLPLGGYKATLSLKQGNEWVEQTEFYFGVAGPVTLKVDPIHSPFGVCTDLVTPFSEPKARLMRDSGIFWLRQGIRGERIYATGKADWTELDEAVDLARQYDLKLLGMFLGAPPGTGDFSTKKSRKAFARYVEEVAKRYPSIRHWEIWNEPDTIDFWGDRDWKRYLALMKEVYPRLKRINPSTVVMNGGLVSGNYWYLGELYQGGIKGFLDVVAIHPYADDPEFGKQNLGMRIYEARSNLLKHDPGRKLWLTEIGWNTSIQGGASLEEQASILVRTMVIALSYREVERILWFTFDNLGEDPVSGVQNAGIVFKDLSPKPSLIAYRNLIQHLTGKEFVRKEDFGKETSAYRFENGQEATLVVWSHKGKQHISLRKIKGTQVLDTMGNSMKLEAGEGEEIKLSVSRDPLFILSSLSPGYERGTTCPCERKPTTKEEMPTNGR